MQPLPALDRRHLIRGAAGIAALGLAGCAATTPLRGKTAGGLSSYYAVPKLAPVRARIDRLFDITVCLRPFRAAGPRLDTEQIGDTLVVHNYGHGGSGRALARR